MQQSLIFLLTNELFIHIMLCHRLYISIIFVDVFFYKLLYTYLIRLQTEYHNFHANSATLISMQTRLYIANPKPCFSKKKLNCGKLHRQQKNHIFMGNIIKFSFIIFLDFIHFMNCFILSTMYYHLFFFHCYQ